MNKDLKYNLICGIIHLLEVVETQKEASEIVRQFISETLLPNRMLNLWLITPGFCDEVLKQHKQFKSFSGVYILSIMKRCIEKSSSDLPREHIMVLRRSYRWLKQNYKELKNTDEVHDAIKKATCLQNREIKYLRRVRVFDDSVKKMYADGVSFSNQNILQLAAGLLSPDVKYDEGTVKISILEKIVESIKNRLLEGGSEVGRQ